MDGYLIMLNGIREHQIFVVDKAVWNWINTGEDFNNIDNATVERMFNNAGRQDEHSGITEFIEYCISQDIDDNDRALLSVGMLINNEEISTDLLIMLTKLLEKHNIKIVDEYHGVIY